MCCMMPPSEDVVRMQTLGFKRNDPIAPTTTENSPGPTPVNVKPKKPLDTKIKRPRGRPRTRPLVEGQPPSPIKLAYLPSPPHPNLRKAPSRFFSYWNGMTKEMLEHVEVRVYRNWPSIDRLASGETKKDIATIAGANPYGHDWEKGMKDFHGCGDYTVYMLETPTGAKVCMTTCELGRDFYRYPPVLNRKELMDSDPINASYVSWLKNNNKFDPADDSAKEKQNAEEKNEMAVNEKLVDSLIEITKRQEARPQIAVAPPTAAPQRDAGEVAAMYKEAATTAISMVENASTKLNNSRTESADPIKQFDAVIGLVKSMKGDDSILLTIMKQSEDRANAAEQRSQALLDRLIIKQKP